MLKITFQTKPTQTKLLLEGRLAGPWVEEVVRAWQSLPPAQQKHLVVDLTGITFIAPEGKELLARMYQQGIRLHAAGCLTRCIVEEITKRQQAWSAESSEKDAASKVKGG